MEQNHMKIKLPRLISDGMVMQRNTQVKIWGWGQVGESIIVNFLERIYRTSVTDDGKWYVMLQTENAGGPYNMVIETGDGADRLTVSNILLGDVWVCSGQSNMELAIASVADEYREEILGADNDSIRQFLVPAIYNFEKPQDDFQTGSWEAANQQSVMNFSAVAYFFATNLYQKNQVPIGLINASLGGSPAEAWMSEETLWEFPNYLEQAKRYRSKDYIDAILKQNEVTVEEWVQRVNQMESSQNKGSVAYFDTDYDAADWLSVKVPSYWEEEGLGHFNGIVWFRKEIELSADFLKEAGTLYLGNIVDEDTVYINGIKVGSTPMQYVTRKYDIPEGILKEGKNVITIRVVNYHAKGGFYQGKPYHLQSGEHVIDISGLWQYRICAKSDPMPYPTFVSWQPTGLYNAMLAPITSYAIKGVIWYQGETNAQRPEDYERLFRALIVDWREKWNSSFPFLYVQLPNFKEPSDSPAANNWAIIREAQRKVLTLPNTGMAVTIDIGEWNDLHPVNKKDVGHRLALAAFQVVYADKTVVTSPLPMSTRKEGKRIIVNFCETGSGLMTKDKEEPRHLFIAGADKVYLPANAIIEDDCIVVWNDKIADPLYVRYAWEDSPRGINLYNREGLPVSPFSME